MRTLHQFWAWLRGYFWLPCPTCGRMFGGHEIGGYVWTDGGNDGLCVCRRCGRRS